MFERDESFDGQADPAVRIEAGRLRRALERYYLVAGQADSVLIEIPKGRYVPTFTRRAVPAPKSPAVEEPPAATVAAPRSAFRARWRALTAGLAALAALAVVLVFLHLHPRFARQPATETEAALPDSPVLLVMPFASLSDGEEARLYAAGVTEEILTQLAQFKRTHGSRPRNHVDRPGDRRYGIDHP